MGGYIGATAVGLTTTAADVQGDITSTDTTPELILKNTSEEDTEGGREGKITFKGEQSGGEETTLAQIESAHDGTSDDEKGDLIFKTNDGNDGAAPTERLRLDSAGDMLLSSPDPSFTITNTTHEDTDGGRESTILFKGEQSGGELSTLAEIEASHDGTADDEKGDLIFRTNDGSDGASPTEAMRIQSDQTILAGSPTTDDDQTFQIIKTGASSTLGIHSNRASVGGSALILSHNRNTSVGSFTALNDDDQLGRITFQGCDGTDIKTEGAQIHAEINGTVGSNDLPTDLVFSTTADGASAITERMRIDNNGDVGIGTDDPKSRLHIRSNNSSFVASNGAAINGIQCSLSSANTENVYLYTSSDSGWSGSTHVGRLESFGCNKLEIGSQQAVAISFGTNNTQRMLIGTGGSLNVMGVYNDTTTSSTNVNVASDGHIRRVVSSRRYKNTINDATHGLAELLTLRPVTYKGNNEDFVVGGLIAEEVHDAGLTEFVEYDDDGEPDALAYSNMVSLCIKAIQELSAKVTTLETQNTTQATQIADLITRVEALEGA